MMPWYFHGLPRFVEVIKKWDQGPLVAVVVVFVAADAGWMERLWTIRDDALLLLLS
jgi:hypothetical protein